MSQYCHHYVFKIWVRSLALLDVLISQMCLVFYFQFWFYKTLEENLPVPIECNILRAIPNSQVVQSLSSFLMATSRNSIYLLPGLNGSPLSSSVSQAHQHSLYFLILHSLFSHLLTMTPFNFLGASLLPVALIWCERQWWPPVLSPGGL